MLPGVVGLAGCGDDDDRGDGDTVTLDVFAAASLTDAFTEIAEDFEVAEPGVDVALNFAGSSALREQILAGAPADVFASADEDDMAALAGEDAVVAPAVFATNRLQIAVPEGNPGGVTGLDAFADDGLLLGLCAAEVPCGRFARTALERAGVVASLDTEEPDVRALLTKVSAGELDAGIVYETDVQAAGAAVGGIPIPSDVNVVARYPIAVIADAPDRGAAEDFVAFVTGPDGQAILRRFGFGDP